MKYTRARLAPTIMTWEGIFNMIWLAAFSLRTGEGIGRLCRPVGKRMAVKFSWHKGDEDVALEAETL